MKETPTPTNKEELVKWYNNGKAYHGSKILCPECNKPSTFTEYLDRQGGYYQGSCCDNCGHCEFGGGKGISLYSRIVYQKKCKCGQEILVTSQEDNNPEYYTEVGIQCPKCKQLVMLDLPVN